MPMLFSAYLYMCVPTGKYGLANLARSVAGKDDVRHGLCRAWTAWTFNYKRYPVSDSESEGVRTVTDAIHVTK